MKNITRIAVVLRGDRIAVVSRNSFLTIRDVWLHRRLCRRSFARALHASPARAKVDGLLDRCVSQNGRVFVVRPLLAPRQRGNS